MRKITLLFALLIVVFAVTVQAQDETFSLTIMHTNDTHTWHEPQASGDGGVALQAAVVNQIRAEVENSLLLDAGDVFTGTLYQVAHQGQDSAEIMNLLGYDAMTLGNHEFDGFGDDPSILQNFVTALQFPVVTANVDFSNHPEIDAVVNAYTTLDVNGQAVGLIGLVTPETPEVSTPGDTVTFDADLLGAVNAAVEALTAEGVNKIILLTHIGIEADLELIPQLAGVDIVIGGHSHTLLSNAYAAASEIYPMVREGTDGSPILYVQAFERRIYLGRLNVTFNAEGVIQSGWSGDTILLSRYITPDTAAAELMTTLAGAVEELRAQPTGASTEVELIGDRAVCRVEECPLGNLITDALLAETGAQIAITNGGGIRANIDVGEISVGDVFQVLPFGNTTATFEISGADVIAALENGVSRIVVTDGVVQRTGANGRFPQVAGLRFSFDPTQEAGSRIVSVEVRQADGTYAPIDEAATYTVASNNFMRQGGDGYEMFRDNAANVYDFGRPLDQVLADYLAANPPTGELIDGRITLINATLAPLGG